MKRPVAVIPLSVHAPTKKVAFSFGFLGVKRNGCFPEVLMQPPEIILFGS